MLKRVLAEIARENQCDVNHLAKRLGASEALVRQMLQALERMGYLRRITNVCAPACHQCPIRQRCSALWQLTPKGWRIVTEAHGLSQPEARSPQ